MLDNVIINVDDLDSLLLRLYNSKIRLIVGLGNPGDKYLHTRHNAGFLFVDYLTHFFLKSKNLNPEIETNKSYKLYKFQEIDLYCLKPMLMMNRSGEALMDFIKYKDFALDEILLVHDDLDIEFGKYKLQLKKSPKLHNGVTSVERQLSGKDFYRLRIGVENRKGIIIPGMSYVMKNYTPEELDQLENVFDNVICKEFVI